MNYTVDDIINYIKNFNVPGYYPMLYHFPKDLVEKLEKDKIIRKCYKYWIGHDGYELIEK